MTLFILKNNRHKDLEMSNRHNFLEMGSPMLLHVYDEEIADTEEIIVSSDEGIVKVNEDCRKQCIFFKKFYVRSN